MAFEIDVQMDQNKGDVCELSDNIKHESPLQISISSENQNETVLEPIIEIVKPDLADDVKVEAEIHVPPEILPQENLNNQNQFQVDIPVFYGAFYNLLANSFF